MKQKALITGASSGLGLEFAKQLKKQGWEVYGIARSEDKLKSFFNSNYLVADLTNQEDLSKTENYLQEGDFNLLVNNAGFGNYTKFLDASIDSQIEMMHLNMDALVRLSYAFLKQAKPGDALLNVSSALSILPMPGSAVYSATKSFVTAFSECLWYEYRDRGIYILTDLPGPVATPFHENAGSSVSAMDPKLTMQPESVVREALTALKKRKKPSLVNGFMFKMITTFGVWLPRKMRLKIMAGNSPSLN